MKNETTKRAVTDADRRRKQIVFRAVVLAFLALTLILFGTEAVGKYTIGSRKTIPAIRVIIKTLRFPGPAAPPDVVYDGTEHTSGVSSPEGVTVTGDTSATNAGTYTVTVSLDDPLHSTWEDGTTDDKTVIWRIVPKIVPIPTITETDKIYDGTEQGPVVDGVTVDVVETGDRTAVDADYYGVYWNLPDTENYRWSDGTVTQKDGPWVIGVCRIEDVLYPSVTEAFDTDRSTRETPVEMLVNWSEEAVNENGEDYFSLNGFTLTSDAATIMNQAELTLLGGGTISSRGDADRTHAIVRNYGTLVIEDGVFETEFTGSASGGIEAYAVWNHMGTTTVEDGSFHVRGGSLAADAFLMEDGELNVNGGTYVVENTASNHGAFGIWQEGGTVTVSDGDFTVGAADFGAIGFMCGAGTITLENASLSASVGGDHAGAVLMTNGGGSAFVKGGTYRVDSDHGSNALISSGSSLLQVEGGDFTISANKPNASTCNGALSSGGEIRFSGGALHVISSLTDTASLFGCAGGTLLVTGGSGDVTSAGSDAVGLNVVEGSITMSGGTWEVRSQNRAYGAAKSEHAGALTLLGGRFIVTGDFATPGEAESPQNPIDCPVPENVPFVLRYRSSYSTGIHWTNAPYIESATYQALLFAHMAHRGETEYGSFTVRTGTLTIIADRTDTLTGVASGEWRVTGNGTDTARTLRFVNALAERAAEVRLPDGAADKAGADVENDHEECETFVFTGDRVILTPDPARAMTEHGYGSYFLYGALHPVARDETVGENMVRTPAIRSERVGFCSVLGCQAEIVVRIFRTGETVTEIFIEAFDK